MIYVIGTANGEGIIPKYFDIIKKCDGVIVKTALSKSYSYIKENNIAHITLDDIYKKSRNFDTLNNNIVKQILAFYKGKTDIAYIVDGSGFEDRSVMLLINKAKDVKVLPAASKAAQILSIFPSASYTVYSAADFAEEKYPVFCKNYPVVIYEVYSAAVASDIKIKLFNYYDPQTNVYCLYGGNIDSMPLYAIDRIKKYDSDTMYLLPPQELLNQWRFDFYDIVRIMDILRGENGCPWDRKQTHSSIKMNAVEEAYELVEAIDNDDIDAMEEESGDLLLQTVFQACIAKSLNEFDIHDVISRLCQKLIFRHSHIFGGDNAQDSVEALATWDKNKSLEKSQNTVTKSMKDIAKSLPSIIRCQKVQKKAAKVGFDFEDIQSIFDKLPEEAEELKQAIKNNDSRNILEECGDLLFVAVNICRKLGIDAETALNKTTDKFIKRFEYIENSIISKGKNIEDVSLEEMELYYSQSKHNEDKTP